MERCDSSEDSMDSFTSLASEESLINPATEDEDSDGGVVSIEDELQSDSETEVNDEDNDDQDRAMKAEGSIHRMCIAKLRKLFRNQENASEEDMIDGLVKTFNEKKKTTGDFELEPTSAQDSDLLCQVLPEDNFQIKLYASQRKGSVPPILKWYGSGRNSAPIHLVWFFYRPGEIFAFTTNQGYRLVHDYSEFDFPNKIAARLCTEKGFTVQKKRLLVGQDWEESRTTRNSERPSASDLPSVYSTFTSELRHNASVQAVTSFSTLPVNVEFKACSVRFTCKLNIVDIPKILNHLSIIAKGLPTFTYAQLRNPEDSQSQDGTDSQDDGERSVPEISTSVFDSFLVDVKNEELYRELDLELAHQFRRAVASKNCREFAFDLGYKHHNQFAMAAKFELVRKLEQHKKNVQLSRRPSLQEILPYLLDYEISSRDASYAKSLLKDHLRIRFTTSSKKSKDDSLMSFLEGELFYNNKIYWRARNRWFEPTDRYVATADKIFIEFLQQHYLKPESPNLLIRGTPGPQIGPQDCTRQYTKQYEDLTGYFLAPFRSRPPLFDLLYVDNDGKIWIYFIAQDFMAHTASLCARINNCFEAIKAACEDQTGPFTRFYGKIEPERRTKLGGNFEIFQSRLRESNIVYALAPSSVKVLDEIMCSGTLKQEKDRKVKITRQVLWDTLRRPQLENGQPRLNSICAKIHAILLNEGYIDSNDLVATKFLYCTKNKFAGTGTGDDRKRAAVYENVLSRFQSGFNSLRPRFELRYIAQKAVYSTNFVIQDIYSLDARFNVKK